MFSELLDRIGDFFSDSDSSHHEGYSDIVNGMGLSGLDLSLFSTDEIKEALKVAMDYDGNNISYGHDISFCAAPDVDARNLAKSTLISKLSSNHIYASNLHTDRSWGGLDSYSGDKVYDAINNARDNQRISVSVYNELMALLKKACHSQ